MRGGGGRGILRGKKEIKFINKNLREGVGVRSLKEKKEQEPLTPAPRVWRERKEKTTHDTPGGMASVNKGN